jgi:hypothetical protein
MHRALVFAVASVFLALSASAHAREVSYGVTGYWKTYAYIKDDGSFGHCGMETQSRTGRETLTLTVSATGYVLSLWNPEWNLPVGQSYGVEVTVDSARWTGRAKVFDIHGVITNFPWDSDFGRPFAQGSQMTMRFSSGRSWRVSLVGTNAAMHRVAECLRDHQVSGNPFQ